METFVNFQEKRRLKESINVQRRGAELTNVSWSRLPPCSRGWLLGLPAIQESIKQEEKEWRKLRWDKTLEGGQRPSTAFLEGKWEGGDFADV